MKSIKEIRAAKAAEKVARDNPLLVWEDAFIHRDRLRAKARHQAERELREAREAVARDCRIEAYHARLQLL